ncbi:MAG: AraC family transcriptional regulator [Chitinophagales bacterium]|nr:AraC family transcriptional regulator [Chitinophagales bacterium]
MDIVIILGASQVFFLSFLLFTKKSKSHGDYILAIWMAFLGLHLIDYYIFLKGIHIEYPHLIGIGVCFPMLHGPFMFVYLLVMTNQKNKFKPIYLLHGLPFLFFTIFYFFDFYLLSAPEKLAYYKSLEAEGSLALTLTSHFNSYIGPVYVVCSLLKLQKHKKTISDKFSYREHIDLSWLKYVIVGFGFVWLMVLLSDLFNFFSSTDVLENKLKYLSLTIIIFFLGYSGIKQKAIFVDNTTAPESTDTKEAPPYIQPVNKYKNSGLKEAQAKEYLQQLLSHMSEKKPYLNGKLSLKDLAGFLDISANHLSQVINEQLGKSFFDFVNAYRVEEFKRLVNESKH